MGTEIEGRAQLVFVNPAARHLLAFVLCIALLSPMMSCAGQTQARTVTEDGTIDALARSGVAVYESFASETPLRPISGERSALALTRWQVSNLAGEAPAHGGYLGAIRCACAHAEICAAVLLLHRLLGLALAK